MLAFLYGWVTTTLSITVNLSVTVTLSTTISHAYYSAIPYLINYLLDNIHLSNASLCGMFGASTCTIRRIWQGTFMSNTMSKCIKLLPSYTLYDVVWQIRRQVPGTR